VTFARRLLVYREIDSLEPPQPLVLPLSHALLRIASSSLPHAPTLVVTHWGLHLLRPP